MQQRFVLIAPTIRRDQVDIFEDHQARSQHTGESQAHSQIGVLLPRQHDHRAALGQLCEMPSDQRLARSGWTMKQNPMSHGSTCSLECRRVTKVTQHVAFERFEHPRR
jgi:hypothetical protein